MPAPGVMACRMAASGILVVLSYLAFVSLGLPDGLLGVGWPSIRADFGRPVEALGALVAMFTGGYLVSSFFSGALLRMFSLGTVLAVATAIASAALFGFAAAPSYALISVAAVAAGAGGGAIDGGLNAFGAQAFTARVLNWLHAFWGLGAALGPVIVTAVLARDLDWRWAYGIVGTAQAALALTFWLTRGRWGRLADAEPPAPQWETLGVPRVWLGIFVFFLYTGCELAVAQWSYSVMTLARDVPEAVAGTVVAGYWASLTAGRVAFGLIADRVPLVPALRLATAGAVAGAALFWAGPVPWLTYAGLVLSGVSFAPIFASMVSLTPARVGRRHADSAIGMQIAAAGLGGAVFGGLFVGAVVRAFGLGAVGVTLVGMTLAFALGFALLARLPAADGTTQARRPA